MSTQVKTLFAAKVDLPAMLPTQDQLERCRNGLTRQMKNARTHQDRARLKSIREEIDFLIDTL